MIRPGEHFIYRQAAGGLNSSAAVSPRARAPSSAWASPPFGRWRPQPAFLLPYRLPAAIPLKSPHRGPRLGAAWSLRNRRNPIWWERKPGVVRHKASVAPPSSTSNAGTI